MLRNRMAHPAACAALTSTRLCWPADRRAVTTVEYAIIAGVLAAVIVLSVTAIGPELARTFNNVATPL